MFNPSMDCVLSEDARTKQETAENRNKTRSHFLKEVIEHHPGLENCSQNLEVVEVMDGWNSSSRDLDTPHFCVENITSVSGASQHTRMVIVRCPAYPGWLAHSDVTTVFTGAGVVSLLSLLVIFIVYWFVPEFNSLHGRIVLSNVISIAFLTTFLITVFNADLNKFLCKIIGYFGYFSSISMFCWMTIMCIDLCSTFLREEFSPHSSRHIRFMSYSLVGWGSGIILALGIFILQQILPPGSDFNAGIGDQSCFISTQGNKFLFLFHLPILIMMLINISFFVIIIIFLTAAQIKTKEARVSRR